MIRSSAASNDFSLNQRIEPPGCGATLGYEGFICRKCLYFTFEQVLDTPTRTSVRFKHTCKQPAVECKVGEDVNRMLIARLEVLIHCLTDIVASTSQYREKAKIVAVETPSFEVKNGSEIHEVGINLITEPMLKIPAWIYEVVQTGRTIIDKTGIQEFLELFGSTFGFFRLLIIGVPKFYFVYISNGLELQDIRFLKKTI
jgi:hypothetical protein